MENIDKYIEEVLCFNDSFVECYMRKNGVNSENWDGIYRSEDGNVRYGCYCNNIPTIDAALTQNKGTSTYLNNIINKIFSLNKEDRIIYADIMRDKIEDSYNIWLERDEITMEQDEELEFLHRYISYADKDNPYDLTMLIYGLDMFFCDIKNGFLRFGIDLGGVAAKTGIPTFSEKDTLPESHFAYFEALKSRNEIVRKAPIASTIQRWTIVRTLMECATGWRLTNDENKLLYNKTDIAKFISFLCGGSEDRIRKQLEDDLPTKDIVQMTSYLDKIGLQKISEKIKSDYK